MMINNLADDSESPSFSASILPLLQLFLGMTGFSIAADTLVWLFHHRAPFIWGDMIHELSWWASKYQSWSWQDVKDLFRLHNEHIIATTRLALAVDLFLTRGRGIFLILASIILQVGSAALICTLLRPDHKLSNNSPSKVMFSGLMAALFLNGNYLFNLSWGFQLQHFIQGFLAVVTSYLLVVDAKRGYHGFVIPCVLLGVSGLALVTLGNGVLFPIALTIVGILAHLPWKRLVLYFATSLCFLPVYFASRASSMGPIFERGDLLSLLQFVLIYLGGPFSRGTSWPANHVTWWYDQPWVVFMGALVALSSVGICLRVWWRRRDGSQALSPLFLFVLVGLTAIGCALARSQFGIDEASNKKYANFAALGIVSVVLSCLGCCRRSGISRAGWGVTLLCSGVLFSIVVGHQREKRIISMWNDRLWESSLALTVGVSDEEYLRTLWPDVTSLLYLRENLLEPAGIGVFAEVAALNEDIQKEITDSLPFCEGGITEVTRFPVQGAGPWKGSQGARVTGWSWSREHRAFPDKVIFISGSGTSVGLGLSTRPPQLVQYAIFFQDFSERVGWLGYIRGNVGDVIYGVAFRGHEPVCRSEVFNL